MDNRSGFIRDFAGSHQFLTDYLIDEVLSQQSQEMKRFLWRTSILERFCPELCCELVGDTDGRKTLRRLEKANLFIVPLDNERHWFRYHHLFAEFLRMRLHENEEQIIPELYQRTIDWFIKADLPREALQYALKARDYERAAGLIEELAPQILERDNHMLVVEWIRSLPQEMVEQRADLCLYLGWAYVIAARMETASVWLETARTLCSGLAPEKACAINGHIYAHRAYIAFLQGNYMLAIDLAQQALELLPAR